MWGKVYGCFQGFVILKKRGKNEIVDNPYYSMFPKNKVFMNTIFMFYPYDNLRFVFLADQSGNWCGLCASTLGFDVLIVLNCFSAYHSWRECLFRILQIQLLKISYQHPPVICLWCLYSQIFFSTKFCIMSRDCCVWNSQEISSFWHS